MPDARLNARENDEDELDDFDYDEEHIELESDMGEYGSDDDDDDTLDDEDDEDMDETDEMSDTASTSASVRTRSAWFRC